MLARSKAGRMHVQRTLAAFATAFVMSAAPVAAADAIATGNGGNAALAKNWGAYETFGGRSFRWVDNNAEIIVRGTGLVHVSLICEGGPSLGALVFPLRVLDASGRQVDHADCAGKDRPVSLLLPARGETHYVLHVDGGGHPVAHDKRILNFRVFALDAGGTTPGSDILSATNGLRLGSGWFPVEHYKGQTFRWVDGTQAQFFVAADRDLIARLRILTEPGPSVGSASLPVEIRDSRGKVVFSTSVRGVQALTFAVHLHAGDNLFVLQLGKSKNLAVPGDRRKLNLRAFSLAALR